MSSKRKLILPTSVEDAAIDRGIAADPDTYEPGTDPLRQGGDRCLQGGRPRLADQDE